LAVAGARRLADVDDLHDFDEGNDEGQARVLDVLELTEASDDTDEPCWTIRTAFNIADKTSRTMIPATTANTIPTI